ncbi:NAD(P)-dependent oxidoreductase [Aurantiacibacter sediminis]|uniref:NAD(P)H-binding protein n=1 Tax=Aurantiacibacter sediminis TaxID=2793064 RepID=A0ABS0N5X8_9SPHN|nr:NAD(P)H-binding protein [Aurantiacibacter sediminis]MBH5323186.1 NAD(P)H-binding protein [Aurantiacibacter sediminis]
MRVLIVGASGNVGGHTVDHALKAGHHVFAAARSPGDVEGDDARLEKVEVDVLKPETLAAAVQEMDAVILTFGAPLNSDTILHIPELCAKGTRNVITAMRGAGVERLICMTAIGAGDSEGHGRFIFRNVIEPVLLGRIMEDRTRQEEIVRASDLNEWVIIRPTELSDREEQPIRVIEDVEAEDDPTTIARADVGRFLVSQLDDRTYHRKTILITN